MTRDIWKWMREFEAAPSIWYVEDPDGNPTNFYESKDAARREIEFLRRHGHRRYCIRSANIHSLELSRGRWDG